MKFLLAVALLPLWPTLLPSLSLKPTEDTMAMVDTVVMVDTMVDTVATEARGPPMPNPRLRLMPLLNPKLMLMPGDTTVILMLMDTDTTDIPTVISAKDLLMPNLRLRLMLGGTDTADTMVDTTAVLM